jgi:lactoylglutathione lyase
MKFGYTIIYVDVVAETLKFYKEAFGFETRFLDESGQYGELETGETTLAFASHSMGEMALGGHYQKTDAKADPLGVELAFVTEDVTTAYDRAVSVGAISVCPPVSKPWGQVVAYVRSQEGSLIEICSPMNG